MTNLYELNQAPQQAEIAFIEHVAEFRRRLATRYKELQPKQIYGYIDGQLVHIETYRRIEATIAAGMAAVAMTAELGFGFI